MTTSAAVDTVLTPGTKFMINDEVLCVEEVNAGTTVSFAPYSVHGASGNDLYVQETLVGVVTASTATSLTTAADFTREIAAGDLILVQGSAGACEIVYEEVF